MDTTDTTFSMLKEHVAHIRDSIEYGPLESDEEDGVMPDGLDFLQDSLDIIIMAGVEGPKEDYRGARILVTFGGPTIWVDTLAQTVEGFWGMDHCMLSYTVDAWDLDEAVQILINC